jgi:hypothetical protein
MQTGLALGIAATVGAVAGLVHSRKNRDERRATRVRLLTWTIVRLFLAFELMRYGMARRVTFRAEPTSRS